MAIKYKSLDDIPPELRQKLAQYFTNVGGDTFAITGLPPELTGGALARYSRAQTGMQLTVLNEFLDENGEPNQQKGSELMDRVLNAFGDESVGELEGAHVGIENISQLGTKFIEDRRIGGSPIEQSTRYVKYDAKDKDGRWRYLRPKEIMESGLGEKFERVSDKVFDVYSGGIKRLSEYFKKEFPIEKFQIEVERNGKKVKAHQHELNNDDEQKAFRDAYNFTIRCAALDVGRCVLPSSTLTHIGLFGNGRFYTNLITFLKSNELTEAQQRGADLEAELNKVIPTFIKRNRVVPQVAEINKAMRSYAAELFKGITQEDNAVTLVNKKIYPSSKIERPYLDDVIASCLYPYTNVSLKQIFAVVDVLPEKKKLEILDAYAGKRESRRDRTGRGIEAGYPIVFDLVGGFAEYRDLERHRMLTQQRQDLTPDLGFIMPPEMKEVGLEKEVEEAEAMMKDLNSDLRHARLDVAAQYATLFNHRIRFMLGMNAREFQHLSELRTQPAGHFSYRAMTMEMARKVKECYPWAEGFLQFVDYSDPGNKISRAKEQSKIAGKNLSKGVDSSVDLV